jgi:hypothetical protein
MELHGELNIQLLHIQVIALLVSAMRMVMLLLLRIEKVAKCCLCVLPAQLLIVVLVSK